MTDTSVFYGGDPIEEEDLSTLDRGDTLEPSAEPEAPSVPSAPAEPEALVPEPSAEPSAELSGEEPASVEKPEEDAEVPEGLKPDHKIPKARFDEVNLKRKAAEARLKQLEDELTRLKAPQDPAAAFDFDAKEEEYMTAVVDGEFAKAKAIRAEIRQAEQAALRAEAAKVKTEAVTQTQLELDFKSTVAELETKYPAFNSRTETFDEDATNEVLELHQVYMQMGKYPTPSDSLRAAADLIALKYGVSAPSAQSPAPSAPPAKQVAAAKRKAEVAASQPSIPQSGVPGTPSEVGVAAMSEEEFDALPESKKAELRGDLV